jgi:hypothetical protein
MIKAPEGGTVGHHTVGPWAGKGGRPGPAGRLLAGAADDSEAWEPGVHSTKPYSETGERVDSDSDASERGAHGGASHGGVGDPRPGPVFRFHPSSRPQMAANRDSKDPGPL